MNLFGKNTNENTEQEGTENKPAARGGMSPIIKFIIGAYLIYTSYTLTKGILGEGVNSGNWYFFIFVVLFVGFAIWLFITAGKQMKAENEKANADLREMEEEEEEERRLRAMYTKEDLEAFEAEQARLAAEAEEDSSEDDVQE